MPCLGLWGSLSLLEKQMLHACGIAGGLVFIQQRPKKV